MIRNNDESGVSGTGIVIEGIIFSTGRTVVQWLVAPCSVAIYESFADFRAIHIDSHPTNRTVLLWDDGDIEEQEAVPEAA